MANQELYSSNSSFFLIGNIPASLHAADLRAFFSRLIEGGVFLCFHYKHRPEHSKDGAATTTSDTPTKCCVAVLKKGREEERDFFKDYSNKNWFGSNGDPLRSKVRIQSLTVVNKDKTPHATSAMLWSDLRPLSELNPPSLMPQGNVGTPLQTFMGLIQSCKLPTHIIKKLRLEFPKSRSTRRYGAVKLDYSNHGNWKEGDGETNVTHGQGANSDKDSSDSEIPSVSLCTHTHRHMLYIYTTVCSGFKSL